MIEKIIINSADCYIEYPEYIPGKILLRGKEINGHILKEDFTSLAIAWLRLNGYVVTEPQKEKNRNV